MFKVKRCLVLAFMPLSLTSLLVPQETSQTHNRPVESAQALLPEQLLSAQKIFIANAPGDISTTDLMKLYDFNQPYSEFYASMRSWGKFTLVPAPSKADLIFAISYEYRAEQVRLVILDPQTRVPLWWFSENAGGGGSKKTRQRDLQKGIDGLLSDVQRLYAASPPQNPSQ